MSGKGDRNRVKDWHAYRSNYATIFAKDKKKEPANFKKLDKLK